MLFIRQGLYQDGVFKFDVHIPENYPDGDCPVSQSYLFLIINNPIKMTTHNGCHLYEDPILDLHVDKNHNQKITTVLKLI